MIAFFIELSFFITHQFISIIIFILSHFLQILQFAILIIFNDFIAKIILQISSSNHFFYNIIEFHFLLYYQLFNHEFIIINQIIDINIFHSLIKYFFILELNINSFYFNYFNDISQIINIFIHVIIKYNILQIYINNNYLIIELI